MDNIIQAQPQHFLKLAQFQIKLGAQTEEIQPTPQILEKSISWFQGNKEYGFYLTTLHPETQEPISLLSIMFQNKNTWWLYSVYVAEQFRRKGVFTSLFSKAKQIAKSRNVKAIKLDVEQQNERAKKTYEKMGMYETGQKLYGFDFFFNEEHQKMKSFYKEQIISPEYAFMEGIPQEDVKKSMSQLSPILMNEPKFEHTNLLCLKEEKIVGYCEYYSEFGIWRNALNLYLKTLYVKKGEDEKEIVQNIVRGIIQKSQLPIQVVRFCLKSKTDDKIVAMFPEAFLIPYNILALDLQ